MDCSLIAGKADVFVMWRIMNGSLMVYTNVGPHLVRIMDGSLMDSGTVRMANGFLMIGTADTTVPNLVRIFDGFRMDDWTLMVAFE